MIGEEHSCISGSCAAALPQPHTVPGSLLPPRSSYQVLSTLCQSQQENGTKHLWRQLSWVLPSPVVQLCLFNSLRETQLGHETCSSLSALWGDSTELPALCSKPGQGWLQAKASIQSLPLLKVQPGFVLSRRSCTQLLPAESHYFLTSAKVRFLLQAFEKSTFEHVWQQQPPLSSSSPSGWGSRGLPACSCLQRFCWTAAFCFQPTRAHRDVPAQRQR